MKKLVCLIMVGILIFLSGFSSYAATNDTNNDENNEKDAIDIELISAEDIRDELNQKNINEESFEEYNICLLIGLKEDISVNFDYFDASAIVADDDNIDEALLEHRKNVTEYFVEYNQNAVDTLSLNEYDYSISFYAPYIEIIFDNISEFDDAEEEIISKVQSQQNLIVSLSNFVVAEKSVDEATINDMYYQSYSIGDAFDDIGITNTQFSGEGIKVGVLDLGYPDRVVNLKENSYTFIGDEGDEHSTLVTSIIGGKTGIAKDVYFYCLDMSDSFTSDVNNLINTYDVDVINMSALKYICGYYTNFDAFIDQVIENSGCTFVKSAGNQDEDNPNRVVTTPGCSMNAITVGSIDKNKNISSFSCWINSDNYILKPDVVAPGGKITNIGGFPNQSISGTSCAAPMVTGTIALLMEEFPLLKANPALVKSILHLGAEMLPTQSTYFDEQAGFGLINYQNMRDCLINQRYWTFNVPIRVLVGEVLSTYNFVTIPYLGGIEINVNLLVNSNVEEADINPTTPNYSDLTIKIYDKSTSQCVASSTIDSSVDYLTFINYSQTNSFFEIKIITEDNNTTGAPQKVAVAFKVLDHIVHDFTNGYQAHSDDEHMCYCMCGNHILEPHSYTHHYQRYTAGSHKSYCACGDVVYNPHVVSGTAGGLGSSCKYCGQIIDFGVLDSIPADYPHTENGSYILPNGIIVLVPEDEEAYLNGTLEFRTGEIM